MPTPKNQLWDMRDGGTNWLTRGFHRLLKPFEGDFKCEVKFDAGGARPPVGNKLRLCTETEVLEVKLKNNGNPGSDGWVQLQGSILGPVAAENE